MLRLVWTALTALALTLVACGSESDACPSGETKACLSDGTTCVCAPACHSGGDPCAAYSLCEGSQCASCTGASCLCSTGICIPKSWHSGQSVSFRHH